MPNRATNAAAFADPSSFATTLVVLLVDEFGAAALNWDAETTRLDSEAAFGVAQPPHAFDRMMAGVALANSDRFYRSLADFVALVPPLNGHGFNPGVFEPLGCAEAAWAITEALLLDPPEDDEPFADDIRLYLGRLLDREGIMKPPDVLAIARRDVADRTPAVAAMHADDPDLLATIRLVEAAKVAEINQSIRDGLKAMMDQLEALHLTNGDASALLGRLSGRRGSRP